MRKRQRSTPRSSPTSTAPQPSLVYHKPLDKMTPDEAKIWLQGVHERLIRKMQRERSYLDHRAARGTHTPTDEAYEADLVLEQELLSLIENLLQGFADNEV